MVNSFKGVPCLVKAYKTARLIDVNKYIYPASLSAGCEHRLELQQVFSPQVSIENTENSRSTG